MAILSNPSGTVPAAVLYITVGALMDVWSAAWWWFMPPADLWAKFWLSGFMITGAVLLVIGLLLGKIGRAARTAEMPPPEVTVAAAQAETAAAAKPATAVPVAVAAPAPPAPAGAVPAQPPSYVAPG